MSWQDENPIIGKKNSIDEDNPNNYPHGILSEDYLQERLKEIKLV